MTANILIRKILIPAVLILSLGLYAWRELPRKADQGAHRRNRLVIGVGRDFYEGPDSRTYLHGSTNTWEALTYLDENLRARPWLAESWQSTDNDRTWIFQLRRNPAYGWPVRSTETNWFSLWPENPARWSWIIIPPWPGTGLLEVFTSKPEQNQSRRTRT